MVMIDWLGGTFKGVSANEVFGLFADVVDVWEQGRGMYNYHNVSRGGGVSVLYEGQRGMGVHIECSGEGCATICSSLRYGSVQQACSQWCALGFEGTRCDVAFDDCAEGASVAVVLAALRAGEFVSDWQDWQVIEDCKRREYAGLTVYIGSRKSDVYLCVYDKAAERARAGVVVEGVWLRYELRFKHGQAEAAVKAIAEDGIVAHGAGWLSGKIEFKEQQGSGRVKLRPRAAWYDRVVQGAAKESVGYRREEVGLNERVGHFARSYGRSLMVLTAASQQVWPDREIVSEIMSAGLKKFDKKSRERVAAIVRRETTTGGLRAC